jgi:hypothetical protein
MERFRVPNDPYCGDYWLQRLKNANLDVSLYAKDVFFSASFNSVMDFGDVILVDSHEFIHELHTTSAEVEVYMKRMGWSMPHPKAILHVLEFLVQQRDIHTAVCGMHERLYSRGGVPVRLCVQANPALTSFGPVPHVGVSIDWPNDGARSRQRRYLFST